MVYFKIVFQVLKEGGCHAQVFCPAVSPAGGCCRDLHRHGDRRSFSFAPSSPQLTENCPSVGHRTCYVSWSSFENRHNRRGSAFLLQYRCDRLSNGAFPWLDDKRSRLRTFQQNAIRRATLAGVKAEAILVDGGEVPEIIRAAQREHADLLVIGLPKHHGLGAFNSTAHDVSDQTPCPLLEVN
jgi:hypothetical protein